VFFN